MLMVKYYLEGSHIHGFGVFAAEDIPAGTVTWRFVKGFDFTLTTSEFENLPSKAQQWIKHYGYLNPAEGGWVICVDEGRFVNHSLDNNISGSGSDSVANKDIPKGTELTCNYFEFDMNAAEKFSGGDNY